MVATAAAASRVVLPARNATAVAKLGTLLAHVPMALPTPGMAAAVVAEATVRLVAVVEVKLGAPLLTARPSSSLNAVFSYTCGGVGHLSRDCVQGSKCYNCSGIVRGVVLFEGLVLMDSRRDISVGIALSHRGALATRVAQRGASRLRLYSVYSRIRQTHFP